MLEISLKGRKAFVTGGARGIGAEICRRFSECGADVAFTYKQNTEAAQNLVEELRTKSVKALAKRASADDEILMANAVDNAVQYLGGLDILVANVGGGQRDSFDKISVQDWREGLETNLTSAYIACKLVYPQLCLAPRGDIILIGSSAAYDGGGPAPYYASAKAGLIGLTRYLMREFSQKDIRINVIHPCVVETEGLLKYRDTPQALEKLKSQVPLGRLSKVEDVANLVAFMCSGLCQFITGQSILVDGGRTLWKK